MNDLGIANSILAVSQPDKVYRPQSAEDVLYRFMNDTIGPWLTIGGLLVLPAACAALLRWAGSSRRGPQTGWSLLGGIMAGVLLGPVIFGRLLPSEFERCIIGGVQEHHARDALISRQGADLEVANFAGWNREQIDELRSRHTQELAERDHALREARWRDQAPLRGFTLVITALVLLGAGAFAVERSDPSGIHNGNQSRAGWISAVSIGLWSAALPGALAYTVMVGWWRYSAAPAALVAAALAIGPWALMPGDRKSADQSEIGGARTVQAAGRVASLLALAIAIWSMWSQKGMEGLVLAMPLGALPIGWMLGRFMRRSAVTRIIEHLLIPTMAACVAIEIDLFEQFAFWPIIVIVLLSGPGRWLGAQLGAVLSDRRRGWRAMRLVHGAMAAGPTQIAVAAIGAHTWTVPENLLLPLLLGAVLMELSRARRFMVRPAPDDAPPLPTEIA